MIDRIGASAQTKALERMFTRLHLARLASMKRLGGWILLLHLRVLYAAGRPVQLADYYKVETAGALAISPDGRWVVFVRNTIVEAENGHHSDIDHLPAYTLINEAFLKGFLELHSACPMGTALRFPSCLGARSRGTAD